MIPLLASLSYRWFQYTSWLIRKFAFIEVKKMHESLCFCFLCRQLWSMYCWLMIIASISSLRTRVYSSPPCPKHVLCVPAARQFCKRLCRSEARSVRALSVCARLSWDEGCITHSWAVACWRIQWVQGVELTLSSLYLESHSSLPLSLPLVQEPKWQVLHSLAQSTRVEAWKPLWVL